MRWHRRRVRWLSGWLIAGLLFMQLAAAAYACPRDVAAAREAAGLSQLPGCDGHAPGQLDPAQPQLCKTHCQQGTQSLGAAQSADAGVCAMPAAFGGWTQAVLLPEPRASHARAAPPGALSPGSPPLYLSLLVLRN